MRHTFALFGVLLVCSCAGRDDIGGSEREVTAKLAFSVVSVGAPARIAPGGTAPITITLKNTGSTTWQPGTVKLSYVCEAGIATAGLALAKKTGTNQIGKEADIFKAVIWHSIFLACIVGLMTAVQAYVVPFTYMVPEP